MYRDVTGGEPRSMRRHSGAGGDDAVMEPSDPAERKRRGAWYTPPTLVSFLVERVVRPAVADAVGAGRPPRVLDPACGDGRVLAAVAVEEWRHLELVGIELDEPAAAEARFAVPAAEIVPGDGRHVDPGGMFDAVVGNPPYLSQLARTTTRHGRSRLGGGPYADVATEFLLRALTLVRPDGGRVALVLPQSILASRDTAAIREMVLDQSALIGLWWAGGRVFDAQVNVCIPVLQRGIEQGAVERWCGPEFRSLDAAPSTLLGSATWSPLVADAAGIPIIDLPLDQGRLGDLARATAGFRDEYYGLVPHVRDEGPGAPLVTAGLIDVGACRWGRVQARFAKRTFAAPRIDLESLAAADQRLHRWVVQQLRPKVVVATQTHVIEAVADPAGAWVPSVPVLSVRPHLDDDLWAVAAVLTAPPVAAWAAARYLGAGLGTTVLKLSAAQVLGLPLPARPWAAAAEVLRRGDVLGCAEAMCSAYAVPASQAEALMAWWTAGAKRRGRTIAATTVV
jgi:N-6 DNA Methylase